MPILPREIRWMKWHDGRRHGCRADFGSGRKVEVAYHIGFFRNLMEVRGDDRIAKYGSDGTHIVSEPGQIDVRSNFELPGFFSMSPKFSIYILTLSFDHCLDIDIHVGEPSTLYCPSEKPILRMAPAWRDHDLADGVDWICTILDEGFAWPEAGLAAGLSIWARMIYQDIANQIANSQFPRGRYNLGIWP